ncbi:MAG: STAS domain-containing protein [Lachnospiraceae bacterium]|nr:STAS domain-containing protein [Lachnospiraceae bacterium]
MQIDKTIENNRVILALTGEIDGSNASRFELAMTDAAAEGLAVTVDLKNLNYVSSAGLRIFLKFQKKLRDKLTIINVTKKVMDIFSLTGFVKFLNISKED